jgi:hypothetical protein
MTTTRKTLTLAVLALLLAPALAAADEQTGEFSGQFRLGFRAVDVSGAEHKYMEDYNYQDGPRLFDFALRFVPEQGARSMADEVTVDVTNFGGDPFETFRLGVRKFGHYNFSFNRTKDTYFYQDIILPPDLASETVDSGGDFHAFNFDRVRDTAKLAIDLSQAAKINFGFERFTKIGTSTTTLDLQRDEFVLDKPIDESLNEYMGGFQYAWSKATLVLEERVRDYKNSVEIFLPGFSEGFNETNASELDLYRLDQPYDYTSYNHTVRLMAHPNSKFRISLAGSLQSLSLDVKADETLLGTSPQGQPVSLANSGNGSIDSDSKLADLDLSYMINDRWAVIASAWYRNLDEKGGFTFGGALNRGKWQIDTTGAKAGLQVNVSSKVVIAGGVTSESRDVKFGGAEDAPLELEKESTDYTGFFATFAWTPSKAFNLTAEAEDNSYDQPFTLASPTDHKRYRVRGRYQLTNGVSFTGTYLAHRFDNNDSGWNADRDQYDVRVAYERKGLSCSLGYANVDVKQSIDQLVSTGTLFPIFYKIDSDFIDGHLRWQATGRVAIGGDAYLYDNSGSFGLSRDDIGGWVELGFLENYMVRLGYRSISYSEDAFSFDDYDADIAEFSIGYRW